MKVSNLKFVLNFLKVFLLTVSALSGSYRLQAQAPSTNVQISNAVVQSNVHRFGVNLGDQTYWDSGQMLKNLAFRNPGFEGLKYRVIFHCKTATATTCSDDNEFNAQPAGYWTGGTYLVISGASYGTSGSVISNTASVSGCSGCGPVLQFDQNVNMAAGDYVEVSKYMPGSGDSGWWDDTKGGGTITTESTDLSPETPGQQALLLSASGSKQQAIVTQYFESYSNLSFIQLNGSFEVTFRAKGVGGNNQLNVSVLRAQPGAAPYLNKTVTLTNNWQDYTLTFTANETGSAVGTIALTFNATGASVELDDVSLDQTNSSSSNTTVFRDDVVSTLQQLNPGTIRMMAAGAALGSDLWNQLQVPNARYRGGFNADATTEPDVAYGIHEFLQLCQTVGSDPWITIPTATTPQEMTDFIQYLTGNGSDSFSALRIARGQSAPWTTVFNKIHIELGNETWNGDFKGESMSYPAYPQWANHVFGAARATSGYQASRFDLVLDGWSQVPWYNTQLLTYSTQHDSIDIAPYLMYSLNNEPESTMFGALMAEPEMFESPGGIVYSTVTGAQNAPTPTAVNVYETNIGSMIGSPTQAQLDALTPSVAAGVATANHMLQMMRLGVQYQNAFALPQYKFQRGDGHTGRLWGLVVDMGTTNRRRPQFLTQSLADSVIGGNMLQTTQSGSNPTWNQPLSSDGVQLNGAHYLQSFAFLNGNAASAVLFNLNLTSAIPVVFSGQNAPSGTVQMTQITSANMTDNNETSNVVQPVSQTLSGFNPASGLSLPPFSMTVLGWTSTVAQAPQFSVPAGTYSTTQSVSVSNTTAGATTYYTTDGSMPSTSSAVYTGPITVSATTTLNAITTAPSFTASPISTAVYTIQPLAPSPTILIPTGTYATTQIVGITSPLPGAMIYYTTDGSVPSLSSQLYYGPIAISSNSTLEAVAIAPNYSLSPVASATYTIAPPTPAPYFTTPGGSYTSTQTVAILDVMGGSIHYTTDGSTPTNGSRLYSSPLQISSSETLNAIAVAPGYSSSPVTSATFTISTLTATPVLSMAGGKYNGPITVSLSDSTSGATIYYTVDGSVPSKSSPVYAGPITVNQTEYFQAAAIAPGYKLSYVADAMYDLVASVPVITGGSYVNGGQSITLSDATPNATIFYTTNGSVPNTGSASYTGPITLYAGQTIRAMAGEIGYDCSSVTSAAYPVGQAPGPSPAASPTFSPVGGTYTSSQTITLVDATSNAAVYYTTDGSTPSATSKLYVAPFQISATATVKAIALAPNYAASTVGSSTYTIAISTGNPPVISFPNGFTANQIHLNGFAQLSGKTLQLVTGGVGQEGSAFYPTPVGTNSFTTTFDFQLPTSTADGFTFTIHNYRKGVWSLGLNADGFGYQTITNSVAVAFGLFQSGVSGAETVGVYSNGAAPKGSSVNLVGSGINLHSGDVFHTTITYSGTTMTVTLTDATTGATATNSFTVNVAANVGASTAYVGFTGSTGGFTSVQNILDWTYTH